MPLGPQGQEKPKTIKDIIDNAKKVSFQRGADKPSWNDVWVGMLQIPEFAEVLASRGVSVGGLVSELQYSSRILAGQNGAANGELGAVKEFFNSTTDRVKQDLSDQIQTFKDLYLAEQDGQNDQIGQTGFSAFDEDLDPHDPAYQEAMGNGMSGPLDAFFGAGASRDQMETARIVGILDDLKRQVSDNVRASVSYGDPMHQVKQSILNHVVGKTMEKLALAQGIKASKRALMNSPDAQELTNVIMTILDQEIALTKEESPLELLKSQEGDIFDSKTPMEVVELVESLSGSFYADLLVRNGQFVSGDAPRYEPLAHLFPEKITQSIAMSAVSKAYEEKSDAVDVRHVVSALLDSWEVKSHLSDLGIKDLMKFQEAYEKQAFAAERKSDTKINKHPQISEKFMELLEGIEEFVLDKTKDDNLTSKVLHNLIKNDESIDKMINKAGLLRRMLKDWNKPYKEALKLKDEEDEKKDTGPKVSDEELNELIAEYCTDYTKQASEGKFDPMIGNDHVLEEVETTLLKRGKKNPLVIGEPGIGKTKVLEGHALRIVKGQVSKELVGSRLLYLDLHQMNDTPYVGVFEGRLKKLLDGVSERNATGKQPPIQLAIDEFAGAQDAGGHAHSEGAKTLLKPYLTSGDLFVIGTTTLDEYEKKVQQDPALSRRFNAIVLGPPSAEDTVKILEGLKSKYTKHHKLRINSKALETVVDLADRYIHGVNHPDKDIDLLDHACAIARKNGSKSLRKEHIIKAASTASKVPEEFLSTDETQRYADLASTLSADVLQQDEAVEAVSEAIQLSKAGLKTDPDRPTGTFLFVGPSGVGKTELARSLARNIYGGEDYLLRYDMSEYAEKHAVARLIGAPPGYVGFEEGGGLVNDVRNKPHSVVLYDEVEKAHEDVFNVLLRPFSNGMLTDGRGRVANMRNTINILTSNIGSAEVQAEGIRRGLDPLKDAKEWDEMARPIYEKAVNAYFKTEFLGRLDGIIYFNNLSQDTLSMLIDRQIDKTKVQLKNGHYDLDLQIDDGFRADVMRDGFDIRYGARPLNGAWEKAVSKPLAKFILGQKPKTLQKAESVSITRVANQQPQFKLVA